MIPVANLLEVYGGDVDADAVARVARCSRCKTKGTLDMQIIYVEGNVDAINTTGQSNADYKFKNDGTD